MRRALLLLVFLLLLPAWAQTDWHIIPRETLGPFRIGMPFEEVRSRAAALFPQVHDFTGTRIIMRNKDTGVEVVAEFDRGGLLDEVATAWDVPRTAGGLGVGSTRAQVTKALGQPDRLAGEREVAYYDELGLAFRYSPSLAVEMVYLLQPGSTIHWDRK